ncbi:outer membrane protein [Afifella aestuarii]|uniref:outer membrane protein n=1 Tax=Afifella aestuarii TaxID=1909496 RepID=UPI000FE2AD34|nr:outer membrane beta-barrel protein [Afifella aestuarii]
MRGLGTAVFGMVVLAGPALAADLPEAPAPYVPVTSPVSVSQWEGFYTGMHFGWSSDNIDGRTPAGTDFSMSDHGGFSGGGLRGYNWLFGNVVLGLEGDITIHETKTENASVSVGSDYIWDAGVYGRLGYTWGRFMPYVMAGGRVAEIHGHSLAPMTQGDVTRHLGWSVGAGLEVAVYYPIRLRAEYLYTRFGAEDYVFSGGSTEFEPEAQQFRGAIIFALGNGFKDYPESFLTRPGNTWSGFYGGAMVSASMLQDDAEIAGLGSDDASDGSFGTGMFLGANYQFGNVVTGLDADLSLREGESTSTIAGVRLDKEPMWDAHVRGRIGYAWDRFLPYLAGGFAITQVHFQQEGTSSLNVEPAKGWTVGAGVDVAITDHVFGRLEYLHDEFEDVTGDVVAGAASFEPSVDTVRAGIAVRLP